MRAKVAASSDLTSLHKGCMKRSVCVCLVVSQASSDGQVWGVWWSLYRSLDVSRQGRWMGVLSGCDEKAALALALAGECKTQMGQDGLRPAGREIYMQT